MTSARVLSTQQAKDSATQLVQLSAQLKDEIGKVIVQGDKLADPNQWDGPKAQKWRGDWGNDKKQLQTSSQQLDELEKRAKQATDAIYAAG